MKSFNAIVCEREGHSVTIDEVYDLEGDLYRQKFFEVVFFMERKNFKLDLGFVSLHAYV